LPSVTIPDSLISIGDNEFEYCLNLSSVTLGNSLASIGSGAFNGCPLVRVIIPATVTNIGDYAFQAGYVDDGTLFPSLIGIYFKGNAPSADASVFYDQSNATAYYLPGTTGWTNFSAETGLPAVMWTAAAPTITEQPQSLVVNDNSTALFSVSASGSEPLGYQWSLNGTNILGVTYSSLTVPSVTPTNLGTYTVVVTDVFGMFTNSTATLSMYPFIAVPFIGAVAYWGQCSTLSVGAWGTGPLYYQWYDDGNAVDGATNTTLTLTSIQVTNAGLYSVVVTSALGSATNAAVQVIVEPAGVSLGFSPTVTISGVVGYNYIIQGSTNLADTTGWVSLANLTLTQPVQIWVDTNVDASSPFNPTHFYQVLPGQ
jgi:hypothetical protein